MRTHGLAEVEPVAASQLRVAPDIGYAPATMKWIAIHPFRLLGDVGVTTFFDFPRKGGEESLH